MAGAARDAGRSKEYTGIGKAEVDLPLGLASVCVTSWDSAA